MAPRARLTELVPLGRKNYAVRFGDTRRTSLDRLCQHDANLPKNAVERTARNPSGLIFAFHSICLQTQHPSRELAAIRRADLAFRLLLFLGSLSHGLFLRGLLRHNFLGDRLDL